jgi:hypothetical protein
MVDRRRSAGSRHSVAPVHERRAPRDFGGVDWFRGSAVRRLARKIPIAAAWHLIYEQRQTNVGGRAVRRRLSLAVGVTAAILVAGPAAAQTVSAPLNVTNSQFAGNEESLGLMTWTNGSEREVADEQRRDGRHLA